MAEFHVYNLIFAKEELHLDDYRTMVNNIYKYKKICYL